MKSSLRAVGLVKSYHQKRALDRVSIEVERGEIVGLLGPNGAGKTTTFSIVLGLIGQDEGKIYLGQEDLTEFPMFLRAQKGLGLLCQEPSAFRKLSVEDNLLAIQEVLPGGSVRKADGVTRMLREFGLDKLAKAKAYTLSGGERRRLEIARAMMTEPNFILLDEPFTGIDPLAVQDLQRLLLGLKEKGIGLLITDHSVRDTLKIVDRAYIIDKGKILKEGKPDYLIYSEEVKRCYLGEGFAL